MNNNRKEGRKYFIAIISFLFAPGFRKSIIWYIINGTDRNNAKKKATFSWVWMNSIGVKLTKVIFFRAKSFTIFFIIYGERGIPIIKEIKKKTSIMMNLRLNSFRCSIRGFNYYTFTS